MQLRQPLTRPGRLPPPPGGRDPPPLDRRDDGAEARWRRSPATATTSMPAIHIGVLFIGREDREGDNGAVARRRRSPATTTTSMPGIDIGALFIVLMQL